MVDLLALLLSIHVEGVEEVLVPLVFLLAGLQLLQGSLGARVKEFALLGISGLERNGNLPKNIFNLIIDEHTAASTV